MTVTPLAALLNTLTAHGGSDLHLKPGAPPKIRINGDLHPLELPQLSAADVDEYVGTALPPDLAVSFASSGEADTALEIPDVGRFRVNVFRASAASALVLRHVRPAPDSLDQLRLPAALGVMADQHRGLILVTGPTGSGKTTTLAAMVDRINSTRRCHILTIEDPIEVIHRDKLASVNQRELRTDTQTWTNALKAAMRQDPDVILVGEMRDTDTVRAALAAAETGHLVMATLHTKDAGETINRVVDFFPAHEHQQMRLALGSVVQGIVCQRLLPTADGTGRIPAMEIAVRTNRLVKAIIEPDKADAGIDQVVAEGEFYGMRTFDQHLITLVLDGSVSMAVALDAASNRNDFEIMLKRVGLDPHQVGAA